MALSNTKAIYGICSFAPYDRDSGEFKGILRVLGDSSLSLSSELVKLNGGSNKYPWSIEDALTTAEVSLTFREYPAFVHELFLGKAPTENAAEASGDISAPENKTGSSIMDATNGVDSLAADTASDLKFGRYVLKATGADTLELYASTFVDFDRGTDVDYNNDSLQVVASITVPGTGGTVSIPNFGIEITGGSGSISFTIGDTAVFEVRPVNSESYSVRVGGSADSTPEFGAVVMATKGSADELWEVDLFRVKGSGLPIGFSENTFSEASVTAEAFYDSAKNGVFDLRYVKG